MRVSCRLRVVMAERGIRHITDLAARTGISRSTLTALWQDRNDGITFDVLARLCEALQCTPGDLLVLVPDNE